MHHKPKHSTHHTAAHSTDAHAESHRWLLPVLLVAQLMVILDITAVNIALPHIAMDLKLSGSTISWTITSYSLTFGSLLLFGGRAADLLGRRRMFVTGLGVFTASSLASAMAGSAAMLFASRAGQGLGAAILSPGESGPARRLAVGGVLVENALMLAMERRLGFVGEPYHQGTAGKLGWAAKAATGAGAALLARRGRRSRAAAALGSTLVLGGELALRWSVFKAGFQSARDPRYTVEPQRARASARANL